MNALQPGSKFFHYTVLSQLGAGFHGEVYEIRHNQTGAIFALKVIHTQDRALPNRVARALATAKGNYWVAHQNVLLVHDLNCEPDGLVWMRTERLYGQTIHELLHGCTALSLPFVLQAGIQAAHGLQAIHEVQIVHRDVKPSNLFYTRERAVKVIDFSIAKVFPEGLETTAGRVGMGTPAYMAPEQLEETHARADPRIDVYGLGISLWEMLAGRNPFYDALANAEELIRCQLTRMPARLSEVARLPPEVDEMLAKALAKDPARRFATMGHFARALTDLQDWLTVEARAGRIAVRIPAGEPPMPGDPNAWRDYRPPTTIPPNEPEPASGPQAKVVLAEARATMLPVDEHEGLACTPSVSASCRAATTAPLPVTSPVQVTSPLAATLPLRSTQPPEAGSDTGRLSASQPDTPLAASRSLANDVVSPRRVPWPIVAALVTATSLAAAVLIWSARPLTTAGSSLPATGFGPELHPVPSAASVATPVLAAAPSSPTRDPVAPPDGNGAMLPTAGPPTSAVAAVSPPVAPSAPATAIRRGRVPPREVPGAWAPVREPPFTAPSTHRVFDTDP